MDSPTLTTLIRRDQNEESSPQFREGCVSPFPSDQCAGSLICFFSTTWVHSAAQKQTLPTGPQDLASLGTKCKETTLGKIKITKI